MLQKIRFLFSIKEFPISPKQSHKSQFISKKLHIFSQKAQLILKKSTLFTDLNRVFYNLCNISQAFQMLSYYFLTIRIFYQHYRRQQYDYLKNLKKIFNTLNVMAHHITMRTTLKIKMFFRTN